MQTQATSETRKDLAATERIGALFEYAALALLVLAVIYVPLTQDSIQTWDPFGLRLLIAASLTSYLLGVALTGRIHLPRLEVALPLSAFLALGIASALASEYRFGSSQTMLNTFVFAAGFLLAAGLVHTRARRLALVAAIAAVALTLAVIGIAQHWQLPWAGEAISDRVGSTYRNPNHFAGFLDLTAPLFLGLALYSRNLWLRLGCAALAVLLLVNAGLTFSRGGWIAVSAACVVLVAVWTLQGLTRPETRWRVALFFATLIGAAVVGTYFVETSPRLRGDLSQRVERLLAAGDPNANARFAIYGAGIQLARDNLWLGVGPGNFTEAVARYRPGDNEAVGGQLHRTLTHALNDYLQVASEKGVFALAAFLLFWLAVLFIRPPPEARYLRAGVVAGIGALLLHGFVDGNLTVVPANAFLAFVVAGLLHGPPSFDA